MGFNTYPNNPFPPSTDQMGEAGRSGSESIALKAIAPEFSVEAQYMTGDLVFYEGQLYRFEEDHDPGAWDSTEVMATTIAENLVMFPGEGLRRTIHTYDVKLQQGGGLDVDENGALFTNVVHNFSTTEQPTGQKWIDGKDVYFKVYTGVQLSSNTDITVDNNFTYDSIVRIMATVKDVSGDDTYITPFQSFGALNNDGAIPRVVNNRLSVNCVGTVSGTATIVIEYTKPTE